jgi:TPR repeat protein
MTTNLIVSLAAFISLSVSAMAGEAKTETLQKQAEAGDAEAQFQLGRLYFRGEGVAKNEARALEWISKSAEQGNTDAIASMGFIYSQGAGVPKDESKAVEWFRRGAEAGSATCKLNLGLLLRQGKTIQLSNDQSLRTSSSSEPATFSGARKAPCGVFSKR